MPAGAVVKNLPANAGGARDLSSIPRLEAYSREENDNPLQDSCLGIFTDREAWWPTVHEAAKNWTQLNNIMKHNIMKSLKT